MRARITHLCLFLAIGAVPAMGQQQSGERPRAREAGVIVGIFQPGTHNAITDVPGVRIGQTTVIREGVNTGITAILPHGGNVFRDRVPAAIVIGNGFGKLTGISQVQELGELETPILLTCTLCVWRAADAMVSWLLALPGMEDVRSINPVVGETNDGGLNDIRARPISPDDVVRALESASAGPVEEGAVGAGRGTVAFGWKGGIGTSSRVVPQSQGGYAVGVLVQSNFGGVLTINGAPVGRELGRYSFQRDVGRGGGAGALDSPDGSIMMVVATDAPIESRNLERLARRALSGLARTGATMSNGSGDYVIAFATAQSMRRRGNERVRPADDFSNEAMTPLFQAVAEATEEAVYNSLFKAVNVRGPRSEIGALPIAETLAVLRKYNALNWDRLGR